MFTLYTQSFTELLEENGGWEQIARSGCEVEQIKELLTRDNRRYSGQRGQTKARTSKEQLYALEIGIFINILIDHIMIFSSQASFQLSQRAETMDGDISDQTLPEEFLSSLALTHTHTAMETAGMWMCISVKGWYTAHKAETKALKTELTPLKTASKSAE